jgi:hypothetical protein
VEAAATPAAHPLSRALLEAVLADRTSDRFVCELIWPRLGYAPDGSGTWSAGPATEASWRESFPIEPQFIAARPPAVALTRSIAKEHKQLLKEQLGFGGYRIGELYPRRTRRATAVNWPCPPRGRCRRCWSRRWIRWPATPAICRCSEASQWLGGAQAQA